MGRTESPARRSKGCVGSASRSAAVCWVGVGVVGAGKAKDVVGVVFGGGGCGRVDGWHQEEKWTYNKSME